MTLTIYSRNYDKNQNVANDGFSNCVFVEDGKNGKTFNSKEDDNLENAINYIVENNVKINEINYQYEKNGEKRYKNFIIK